MKCSASVLPASVLFVIALASPSCGPPEGEPANNNNNNQQGAVCGNGVVEPGEECDLGSANSDLQPDGCRANCRAAHCGDGVRDTSEACDGVDLGGTCSDAGDFDAGTLACDASCALDTSACTRCGDGQAEGPEGCDGADFRGESCASLGAGQHGVLVCDGSCQVDTGACHTCGDGSVEGPEQCEPQTTLACDAEGYSGGTRRCTSTCDLLGACQSVCGNGLLEPDEECEPGDLGGATCTALGYEGGTLSCSSACRLSAAACTSCGNGAMDIGEECDGADLGGQTCAGTLGAGYSGALGCTSACRMDRSACVAPGTCGNGVADAAQGEQCDAADLGGWTCATLPGGRYGSGALTCTPNCTLDESECLVAEACGNGVQEGQLGEECDGADVDGQTCATLGFPGGSLGCDGTCRFEVSGCDPPVGCGDAIIDAGELCDGAELDGQTCAGLGFAGGTLACTAQCRLDISACSHCGDGAMDPGELCDGADLGGKTCGGLGLGVGTLACTPQCQLDASGCTLCGNGAIDPGELCDGADLGEQACADVDPLYTGGTLACAVGCLAWDTSGCTEDPCGNGNVDGGEQCDDGNRVEETECPYGVPSCAACSADCSTPLALNGRLCGDGFKDPEERCDDGNQAGGDGCSADCQTILTCGDGTLDLANGEQCDDGNLTPGDGCDAHCQGECPGGWAYVPAGPFEMGCHAGEQDGDCPANERPRHSVTLGGGYCLQLAEVTVGEYRACVDAAVCTAPNPGTTNALCNWSPGVGPLEDHPVNCVDWSQARVFCTVWEGGDLPTEAEWEKAARGTSSPDGFKYPWGDGPEPDCTLGNYDANGLGSGRGCAGVAAAPATWVAGTGSPAGDSPYGLLDMAGNLWEWTLDYYKNYYYDAGAGGCTCGAGCNLDPLNDCDSGSFRTVRGGGFIETNVTKLRTASRAGEVASSKPVDTGIRCRRAP